MKRWILAIAQLTVGLAMVPQVLLFGVAGALGSLGMSATGHFDANFTGVPKLYLWGLLIASFSVDIAAVLSLIGAALTILKPSYISVRICVAGAICYWIYIVGHLMTSWALQIHLTFRYLTVWDVIDYPIGIIAALAAYALYSQGKVHALP